MDSVHKVSFFQCLINLSPPPPPFPLTTGEGGGGCCLGGLIFLIHAGPFAGVFSFGSGFVHIFLTSTQSQYTLCSWILLVLSITLDYSNPWLFCAFTRKPYIYLF